MGGTDRRRLRRGRRSGEGVGVLARGRAAFGHVGARGGALDPSRQSRRVPTAIPRCSPSSELAGTDLEPFVARSPPDISTSSPTCPSWSADGAIRGAYRARARCRSTPRGGRRAVGRGGHVARRSARGCVACARPLSRNGPDAGRRRARPRAAPRAPCARRPSRRNINPWAELEKAIGENRDGLVGRLARKGLGAADRRRCALPPTAGHVPLRAHSRAGARIVRQPRASGVLDNPYRLFEIGCSRELAFSTIDRGLWPQDADARAALEQDPIDEPVTEPPTIGEYRRPASMS